MTDKIAQLEELCKLDPSDETAWFLLGKEFLKVKNFAQAINAFETAILVKPEYTAAYRQLGDAFRLAELREGAIDAYRRGIEVAAQTRDLQTAKECAVFLKKLGETPPDISSL